MNDSPAIATWMYDESAHCGVDYSQSELAQKYDDSHQSFRNVEQEFAGMLRLLGIETAASMTALDMGCGTGLFTRQLAGAFAHVHAVDISAAMLSLAREKAGDLPNVSFHHAGFLTYAHADKPVDVVISKMALHHLPDFWKQAALLRVNAMLKPGGLLYIHDVVFGFEPREYDAKVRAFIDAIGSIAGSRVRRETETHIRDEYSTFAWILEGMLHKAGFVTEQCITHDGFITEYVCRKTGPA